ncbi:MAG: hypothetical protein DMG59_28140 [Acidobacteria bacterium]|nr:MAG: hypothetical protein DMG59_28140 [Acidobacteriota bacterium]
MDRTSGYSSAFHRLPRFTDRRTRHAGRNDRTGREGARIVHDLAEAEKHCAACTEDLRLIGEETSEHYEYIPAQVIVIEDICKKYACSCTVLLEPDPQHHAPGAIRAQWPAGRFSLRNARRLCLKFPSLNPMRGLSSLDL